MLFRSGDQAVVPATLYFVVSLVISFFVCVSLAAWVRGGRVSAVVSVLRTPAIVVAVPAILLSSAGWRLPVALSSTVGLLAGATIPTMLFALGLQLAETRGPRFDPDVFVLSAVRLVAAPLLAAALAPAFQVGALDRSAGIAQAAMPSAVLVAIISTEYQVAPRLVMATVFVSTVLSVPTLTVLLAVL